jgi:hypothetical protein
VSAFAKETGVDLTAEEAAELAARLPDDALEDVAGGANVSQPSYYEMDYQRKRYI